MTGVFATEEEITTKDEKYETAISWKRDLLCTSTNQRRFGWAHGSHNIAWISLSSLLSSSFFWDWMIFMAVSVRINQHSQILYYQLLLIWNLVYNDYAYTIPFSSHQFDSEIKQFLEFQNNHNWFNIEFLKIFRKYW